MRISDWSSDVCSSDLSGKDGLSLPGKTRIVRRMSVTVSLPSATASLPTLRSWVARWRRSAHDWTPHRVANRQLSPNSPDILDKISEEHTSELQSLMRISYAVFCLKKKTSNAINPDT